MENYSSSGAMGSFKGMGTWWWDPKAQVFRGLWCDNMTPNGCDTSGSTKWEGDQLVGTMQGDMGGQMMMMKFIYSDFKPDSFVMAHGIGPRRQQDAEDDDRHLHEGRRRENVGEKAQSVSATSGPTQAAFGWGISRPAFCH